MRAIDDFDGPNSSPYDRHVGLTSQACFSCLALAFPVPVLGLTSGVGILRAIRSIETKEVHDRGSLIVRNGAGRVVLGGQYRDGMAQRTQGTPDPGGVWPPSIAGNAILRGVFWSKLCISGYSVGRASDACLYF